MILIGVDHFKLVNDHHGHDAGDRALRLIADTIKQAVRAYDVCARTDSGPFSDPRRARRLPCPPCGLYDRALVHEGVDFVLRFTLFISVAMIALVAITVAIFLYVRRRSRSAD